MGIEFFALPGIGLFRQVIHESHPNLRFPKKTKLGVCDKCTDLRTRKLLAKSVAERTAVKKEMQQHTNLHRSDRRLFWNRRERSATNPTIQWSILSDSTSRLAIPNIAPLPKGWSSLRRLPITVFGLINFALKYRNLIPYLGV